MYYLFWCLFSFDTFCLLPFITRNVILRLWFLYILEWRHILIIKSTWILNILNNITHFISYSNNRFLHFLWIILVDIFTKWFNEIFLFNNNSNWSHIVLGFYFFLLCFGHRWLWFHRLNHRHYVHFWLFYLINNFRNFALRSLFGPSDLCSIFTFLYWVSCFFCFRDSLSLFVLIRFDIFFHWGCILHHFW